MAPHDPDDPNALMRRQGEVRGDVELLRAQADRLAAVWTGLRMDGPDIVVLLTDPAPHADALRALVDHPDRVHFRPSRYTRAALDAVHRQVQDLIGRGTWQSHAPGLEAVMVELHADQAALAEQLHRRFGDAVEIRLGRHRYPLDPAGVLEPPPAPTATVQLPDLVAVVQPDRAAWTPGEDIRGRIALTNRGATALTVAGHAIGTLLDDEGRPVGSWDGTMTLGLVLTTIEPGRQESIPFVAGSNTSDPRLGAALPPGTYQLVIPLEVTRGTRADRRRGDHGDVVVTPPHPIRLEVSSSEVTDPPSSASSS